jgi:phenylacetate-CoA ligase
VSAAPADETQGVAPAFARHGETAFANAWRSPFFRRKLRAAGVGEGRVPSLEEFRRIPPTTKEELRELSDRDFSRDLVIAGPGEVATIWRSGGVTGRPLFYPRARADYPLLLESFTRGLEMAGVGPGDLVHNSFPLGVHPLGHMFCYAAMALGAGCIPAGSGHNTPTEIQIQLLFGLRATVWAGLASYLVHIGHVAESMGVRAAEAGLRLIVNSGEPLTPAKRARIERTWGARLISQYGMSECSMLGSECELQDGFHVWTDLCVVEILEPGSWRPLPEGEVGMVVVTPLHNSHATPFLRWVSGDVGSLHHGCGCDGPLRAFPRLRLTGRTAGFSKVKGVNIGHQEMEDVLLRLDGLADYAVWVETADGQDRLRIEIEAAADRIEAVTALVGEHVARAFELRPRVQPVPRGTIARRLEADVKQVRFRDVR